MNAEAEITEVNANKAEVNAENRTDDGKKKQVPLRLNAKLWEELNRWAADDFRSLNGQIEYLLTQCIKKRRGEE